MSTRGFHKKILVFCDNLNTVRALNSGASKDVVMQAMLRELHWVTAKGNCMIRGIHISGVSNRISDIFSRAHKSKANELRALKVAEQNNLVKEEVNMNMLTLKEF